MLHALIFAFMSLAPAAAAADKVLPPDLAAQRPMNGIDPKAVGDFWNRWRLVTVRFRQDNGEQRFVYANDSAWRALAAKTAFPDGAMLGKVAFRTGADPAFPSSQEPRDFTRVQLMLKDKKRFAANDGWAYALYLRAPQAANSAEDATAQEACHACHKLVPDRDFVFSHAAFLADSGAPDTAPNFLARFKPAGVAVLPAFSQSVVRYFGVDPHAVRVYAMPLFTGSLDESVGPLGQAAHAEQAPFLLADDEHHRFLLTRPLPATPACAVSHAALNMNFSKFDQQFWKHGELCNGATSWGKLRALPPELK